MDNDLPFKKKVRIFFNQTDEAITEYWIQEAQRLVDYLSDQMRSQIYNHSDTTLTVSWSSSPNFYASAGASSDNSTHHITIGYELLEKIYKDSLLLSHTSVKIFADDRYKLLFGDKHRSTNGVLPEDTDPDQCKLLMFRGTVTFIFFHELAHLIQGHGFLNGSVNANKLHELVEHNLNEDTSTESVELSHYLEICADTEAINWTLQAMAICSSNKKLNYTPFYMLVCGLTCMFHRFFESSTSNIGFLGSHPNPSIRKDFVRNTLLAETSKRIYKENSSWKYNYSSMVMDISLAQLHAHLYWHLAHNIEESMPRMMSIHSFSSPDVQPYLSKLFSINEQLSPKINQYYLGKGEASTLSHYHSSFVEKIHQGEIHSRESITFDDFVTACPECNDYIINSSKLKSHYPDPEQHNAILSVLDETLHHAREKTYCSICDVPKISPE